MIGKGRRVGNLYFLQSEFSNSSFVLCNVVFDEPQLWHVRLGHPAFNKISLLEEQLNIGKFSNLKVHCDHCHLAKQKRLSFPHRSTPCINSFDLIHVDLWGLFTPIFVNGFKYFLTIINDHSRFTWIDFLKLKSEVAIVLSQFYTLIQT